MFIQYFNIKDFVEYYLSLTNVYKHLFLRNNSPNTIEVYYRNMLIYLLQGYETVNLKDVFDVSGRKKSDENVQLKFYNTGGGASSDLIIINYGV